MDSLVALDIGTSGCRAAVCFADGRIGPVSTRTFAIVPPGERAEQDPAGIMAASTLCVNEAAARARAEPRLLVLSTVLHSLVFFDSEMEVVLPMSIWSDTRAREIAHELAELHDDEKWVEETGCISSPSYPFYRILWSQRRGEFHRAGVRSVGSLKSYLLQRWTGVFAEDTAVASGSGLYNIKNRTWDSFLCTTAGITAEMLPVVFAPRTQFSVRPGIFSDSITTIAAGSGDGALAHIGTAGRAPGIFSFTIGTSAAVRTGAPLPLSRAGRLIWSYAVDDSFFVCGRASNNGGNVADHYVRENIPTFTGDWTGIDRIVQGEKEAPLFSPFLFGERNESYLKGPMYGFAESDANGKPEAARMRGVLEGIVFHIAALAEDLSESVPVREIRLSGSLTRLTFVQMLLSTILRVPVRTMMDDNAVLRGAAAIFLPAFRELDAAKMESARSLADEHAVRNRFSEWKERFIWDRQ